MVGPAETNGRSEWRLATFPNWSSRGKPEKNYEQTEQTQKVIQSNYTRRDGGDRNAGQLGRRNGDVHGSKRSR